MDSDSARGINRRRLLGWGGLAAGMVAGAPLLGAQLGNTASAATDPGPSGDNRIPPDTRPGGTYDRYVAKLAAEGQFSGVVLLSHRGRTVLSRSYGMADKEKGIRNSERVAFNLSSASQPFGGKNPGRSFIGDAGGGGFATAPDLVRFAHALDDGTVLDRPYAELLTGAKIPQGGAQAGQPAPAYPSFMAYTMPVHIIKGQWVPRRAGANPGIGASWNIYSGTGWFGVILANCDSGALSQMSQQEIQAVTGQPAASGGGGAGG